uniref:Uncharacterized protein n=1 Tax=Setaria italica TaxID=4555 RepID=K3YET8_SETIT
MESPVLEPLYGLLPPPSGLFLHEDGNRVQLHHGARSIHPRLLIMQDKVHVTILKMLHGMYWRTCIGVRVR